MSDEQSAVPRVAENEGGAETSGVSRRNLLRAGAGLGAAGVAVGLLGGTGVAAASTLPAGAHADGAVAEPTEPVVAYLRDVRTGEVDLFVGQRHIPYTDHRLAAMLARAAQ
jgi:hypothetical protein